MVSLVEHVAGSWPPQAWRGCHVMVAVSGGGDSVALLRLLHELADQTSGAGRLIVGHYNHRLRGAAADDDEHWVRQLADRLELDCVVGYAEPTTEITSEASARAARYRFLGHAAECHAARFLATAHTADDQVETVLMRLFRGSGIDGLAGIPATRPLTASVTVVRPLLQVRRQQIDAYLAALGQDFRTDATNHQADFTRNWVRHRLLPQIRERLGGEIDGAISRLSDQARDWRRAHDQLAETYAEGAVAIERGGVTIDRTRLATAPPILVQQICRQAWRTAGWPEQAMGMSEWQRLAQAVVDPAVAPFTLPGGVDVRLVGPQLVLAKS